MSLAGGSREWDSVSCASFSYKVAAELCNSLKTVIENVSSFARSLCHSWATCYFCYKRLPCLIRIGIVVLKTQNTTSSRNQWSWVICNFVWLSAYYCDWQLLTVTGGHWWRWFKWCGFCCCCWWWWRSVAEKPQLSADDSKTATTSCRTTPAAVHDDSFTSRRIHITDTAAAKHLGQRRPSTTYIGCSSNQLTDCASIYVITPSWDTLTSDLLWDSSNLPLPTSSNFLFHRPSSDVSRDIVLRYLTDNCRMPMTLMIRYSVAVYFNCRMPTVFSQQSTSYTLHNLHLVYLQLHTL